MKSKLRHSRSVCFISQQLTRELLVNDKSNRHWIQKSFKQATLHILHTKWSNPKKKYRLLTAYEFLLPFLCDAVWRPEINLRCYSPLLDFLAYIECGDPYLKKLLLVLRFAIAFLQFITEAVNCFSWDIISRHFKSVFVFISEVSWLGSLSFAFWLTSRYSKKKKKRQTGESLKCQCSGY